MQTIDLRNNDVVDHDDVQPAPPREVGREPRSEPSRGGGRKTAVLRGWIAALAFVAVGLGAVQSASAAANGGSVAEQAQAAQTTVRSRAKAKAIAKAPPDCGTGWTSPKGTRPKTFAWDQTSSWVHVKDGHWVRFRSLGGSFYEKKNRICKTVRGWRAGAGLYQTKTHFQGPPNISKWWSTTPGENSCGSANPKAYMNQIVGCYRGKLYNWTPKKSPL